MKTLAFVLSVAALAGQPRVEPGPVAGGGNRLVSGWIAKPAGRQIALSNLPMTSRLSADGKWLFILQAGHAKPSVSAHRVSNGEMVTSVTLQDAWLGLAVAGNRILVGGGASHAVHELHWSEEKLQLAGSWKADDPEAFIGDVKMNSEGRVFAASLLGNAVLEFDAVAGKQINSLPTGAMPYRILCEKDQLMVTSWSGASVVRHRLDTGVRQTHPAADHSSDILRAGKRYFVAAANTNQVLKLNEDGSVQERINVSLTPRQPVGMTPSALAVSADGKTLYVVCSDANAVAVVDVSGERSRVVAFIPTGWYPASIQAMGDGRLFVLNGKGLRSFAYNTDFTLASKTDAKNQKITSTYDSYKRLTEVKRFTVASDSGSEDLTQRVTHDYDSNPFDGSFTQNGAGRRTATAYYMRRSRYSPSTPLNGQIIEMYSYSTGGLLTKKRILAVLQNPVDTTDVSNYTDVEYTIA